MAKNEPPLTIEKFYEKSAELNEVYRNNFEEMNRDFYGRQEALFNRLSPEDRAIVQQREIEKLKEKASVVMKQHQGLVDHLGRPTTTH